MAALAASCNCCGCKCEMSSPKRSKPKTIGISSRGPSPSAPQSTCARAQTTAPVHARVRWGVGQAARLGHARPLGSSAEGPLRPGGDLRHSLGVPHAVRPAVLPAAAQIGRGPWTQTGESRSFNTLQAQIPYPSLPLSPVRQHGKTHTTTHFRHDADRTRASSCCR